MVNKEQIMDKLNQVIDPELGMGIVDLGLIYEVDIKEKHKDEKKNDAQQQVFIKMTFTTPACPMINDILNEIQAKLNEIDGLDIELSIVFEPLWNPSMMSEKAKIKLGMI
ncbi:metal-sulfur cluster assembly factor [Candidatus Micrarchaeota archaeon]|nr:metal-sulfur cluster assembly factor [Candidatus Micrarchaeota archaeon]